jgi:hypothetical protein
VLPASVGEAIESGDTLGTALAMLDAGLWPVVLYPLGAKIRRKGENEIAEGKEPIGNAWGSRRPTPQAITARFSRNPGANVGLRLGPESGLIDLDCDGPGAEESCLALLGGELVETFGWMSARGRHLLFLWDPRLATLRKSSTHKTEELPGLELRFGELGKQLQSAIPPSIGTDGKAREWNGIAHVARLPECSISLLCSLHSPKTETASTSRKPRNNHKSKRKSELSPEFGSSDETRKPPEPRTSSVNPPTLELTSEQWLLVDRAIAATAPREAGKRHHGVFEFARRLRAIFHPDVDPRSLLPAVLRWFDVAKPFVTSKAFGTTWHDFLAGWGRIRTEHGTTLAKIVADAQCDAFSLGRHPNEDKVARVLRAAARYHGGPFPFDCRTLGDTCGISRTTAQNWCRSLQDRRLLKCEDEGAAWTSTSNGRPAKWRWAGSLA